MGEVGRKLEGQKLKGPKIKGSKGIQLILVYGQMVKDLILRKFGYNDEWIEDQELESPDHFWKFLDITSWYNFFRIEIHGVQKFLQIEILDGSGSFLSFGSQNIWMTEVGCYFSLPGPRESQYFHSVLQWLGQSPTELKKGHGLKFRFKLCFDHALP